jgi:hypothetical protein
MPTKYLRTVFGEIQEDLYSICRTTVSHHHHFILPSSHIPGNHNLLGFIPVLRLNLFCSQVLMIAPSFSLLISPVIYPIVRPICFSYNQSVSYHIHAKDSTPEK